MSITPVVLVTGASRGIGRGIARCLARAGYSVAVNYAGNRTAAEETVTMCRAEQVSQDQEFQIFQADVADREQRFRMVSDVFERMGRLDALVNNAGIGPRERRDITDATEASFEEVLRTNLQGPYFLTQAIVNRWLEGACKPELKEGFKIVFVTSISAHTASVNRGEYCISKAGLSMAVQLWATRLADAGVQVYEVRPGIMMTDMTAGVKEKYDALIDAGVVPQKRWGTPEDVGEAVSALVSGAFAYSTGTVVDVDGGFQLRRL